jgi:hypothetical protein
MILESDPVDCISFASLFDVSLPIAGFTEMLQSQKKILLCSSVQQQKELHHGDVLEGHMTESSQHFLHHHIGKSSMAK